MTRSLWLPVQAVYSPSSAVERLSPRGALALLASMLVLQLAVYGAYTTWPPRALMSSYEVAAAKSVAAGSDVKFLARQRLSAHARTYAWNKLKADGYRILMVTMFWWVVGGISLSLWKELPWTFAAITIAEVVSALAFFLDIGLAASGAGMGSGDLKIGGVLPFAEGVFAPLGGVRLMTLWWCVSAGSALAAVWRKPLVVVVPLVLGVTISWVVLAGLWHQVAHM